MDTKRCSKYDEGFFGLVWLAVKSIFSRRKTPRSYLVVEVEKGVTVAKGGDDAAIVTLRNHPGFIALQNRRRLKIAALTALLAGTKHADIRSVDYIQCCITGLRLDQFEVDKAIGETRNREVVPSANEIEQFEAIRAAIEGLGDHKS